MESSSLRDRKREATRRALQTAALQLMSEQGFAATTLEQIADRANVSARTIFRYFRSKEDVVLSDAEDEVFASFLMQAPEELGIVDGLRWALREYYASLTPERWAVSQQRSALMMSTPELSPGVVSRVLGPLGHLQDFVAQRLALAPDSLVAATYAGMLTGAIVGPLRPSGADVIVATTPEGILHTLEAALDLVEQGLPA
jgi:AcrR family transcriptional regulator